MDSADYAEIDGLRNETLKILEKKFSGRFEFRKSLNSSGVGLSKNSLNNWRTAIPAEETPYPL